MLIEIRCRNEWFSAGGRKTKVGCAFAIVTIDKIVLLQVELKILFRVAAHSCNVEGESQSFTS